MSTTPTRPPLTNKLNLLALQKEDPQCPTQHPLLEIRQSLDRQLIQNFKFQLFNENTTRPLGMQLNRLFRLLVIMADQITDE